METTKLSSKGQLVLPKSIRDAQKWRPGTQLSVEQVNGGVLLKPLKPFPATRFKDVFGCLKYKGRPKTIAEMDQAIGKMVRERHARGRY